MGINDWINLSTGYDSIQVYDPLIKSTELNTYNRSYLGMPKTIMSKYLSANPQTYAIVGGKYKWYSILLKTYQVYKTEELFNYKSIYNILSNHELQFI